MKRWEDTKTMEKTGKMRRKTRWGNSTTTETLRMGSFTVIAGANASGKSNVRDAFRFLHGIGRGYGLADIIGGKYGAGGEVQWEPIRGAAGEIVRFGASCFDLFVTLKLPGSSEKKRRKAVYGIRIGDDEQRPGTFRVMREALSVGQTAIYTSRPPSPDPVRDQDDDTHLLRQLKSLHQLIPS